MRVAEGQGGSGRVWEGQGGCVRVSLHLGNGNIILSLNIWTKSCEEETSEFVPARGHHLQSRIALV